MKSLESLGTVHSSDILVIGGSIAGVTTAITAKESDPSIDIIIVDKASASKGWAGKAARTVGLLSWISENNDPEEFVRYCLKEIGFFLNDQNLLRDFAYNTRRIVERLADWGVQMQRKEDGTLDVAQWPFPWVTGGIDPDFMTSMSKHAKKLGVKFIDRIVIVDLLKDGDHVCGACGFNIRDGSFHIFKANAVMLSCGSQNFDITPIWCSTGLSQAAAYRAGAQLRNVEFANMGDFARFDPETGYIFYGSHGGAHTGHDHLYANGENISQKWRPGLHSSMDPYAANAWYQETLRGNTPIECNIAEFNKQGGGGEFFKFHSKALRRDMRRHQIAGFPFDHPVFQVVPGIISEMSCIRVNNQMETTVSGLFAAGDAAGSGSARAGAVPAPPAKIHGTGIMNALFMGDKAGPAIAAHARTLKKLGTRLEVPVGDVERIKEHIYGMVNRKNGINPYDIIHRVQDCIAPVDYSMIKSGSRNKEALEQVLEIKKDLPKLTASDYHMLSKCIDAESMVLCAEMFHKASLTRTESRGFHLREDYPEMDNENWLKWIIIQRDGDDMKIFTEDIPIESYHYKP